MRAVRMQTCLVLVGVLLVAATAEAKSCGDGVECSCGDTVRGTAVLSADLSGCPDDGLRLKGDAVLDCAGHRISGTDRSEGLALDRAAGAVVRNCRVQGFKTGIRIRGGGGNLVVGNEVVDNRRYGIELAKATRENRIEANLVAGSGDEGIHIGTGAHATVVVGNEIRDSSRENLYVLSSDGGTFVANVLTGSGKAAIYMKHSSDNLFSANDVQGHIVHVRGHSIANRFEDNRLEGGRYVFEAYKGSHPAAVKRWTRPADNAVVGGSVLDVKTCFQFKGASDNRATDVVGDGCKPMKQSKKGGQKAKRNSVSLAAT